MSVRVNAASHAPPPVHYDVVHRVLNLAPEVRELGRQLVALPLKTRYIPT